MKVLILVHSLGLGGAQKQATLLCKNLRLANIICDIVRIKPPRASINSIIGNNIEQPEAQKFLKFDFPHFDPGLQPHFLRKNLFLGIKLLMTFLFLQKRSSRYIKQISRENYDWVIPFSLFTANHALALCIENSKTKMFLNNRGGKLITVGSYLDKNIQQIKERFHVMSNSAIGLTLVRETLNVERGILLKNFIENKLKDYIPIKTEFILIHIANYFTSKDYDTLLIGYELFLRKNKTQSKLKIYSKFFKTKQLKHIQNKIKLLRLDSCVELFFKAEDPTIQLSNASVGLLSTLSEGCSNTLLEYMSYSLPILTTRIDSNVELLGESYIPFMFEPKNPFDFAEKLSMLASSIEKRMELSNLSRERYNEYNSNTSFSNFIEYLKKYNLVPV